MKKLNILYIVNFWGNLPHNYFIKYLKEKKLANISVIVLPVAPHQEKGKVLVDAFFINKKSKRHSLAKKINLILPHFWRLVLHYLINLYVFMKISMENRKNKFDLCVGENYFNGTLALLVKKIGLARHSIFVTTDVFPDILRKQINYLNFSKPTILTKTLNKIIIQGQFFLAKLAYKNELVWYINDRIRIQDSKLGLIPKDFVISPGAIDPKRVKRSQKITKTENSIAYMGNLGEQLGVDIAIKSLSIVKKKIKDFKFVLIGGSPYLVSHYTGMAKKYGILRNVKFHGFVEDFDEAIDIIASCKIGLALYKPGSASVYTDVSKVKNYLQALLPIIIVKPGPLVYKEIEAYQAGICVKYDEEQIARAILDILENRKLYNRLLRNVVSLSEKFDYKNLCSTAFEEITNKLDESK